MPRGRGKQPKRLLKDVARELPNDEEHAALTRAMTDGPPIVTAILGQALVEIELENLLRTRLKKQDDDTWDIMTEDGAPLNTFRQKITAGLGLWIEVRVKIVQHRHNPICTVLPREFSAI